MAATSPMSDKSIPIETSELDPNMPKSCVVVSATLSTGHQNTFRGTDCWQVAAKQKQTRKGAPLCHSQLPPHLFSPEIVYILQQIKAARRVGEAEPPHLVGLTVLRAECGLIRKYRVYRTAG